MARTVGRGDIWLFRFAPPDKRRPVLILSRQEAIDSLTTVMVAPISSTRHAIATEVEVDSKHGLKAPCAVNLDHVHTIPKRELRRYLGTLPAGAMMRVCRALAIAAGCAES